MARNIEAGDARVEQGSHHHPPRARHADRQGAGADQRPQEALRPVPRALLRRGRGPEAHPPHRSLPSPPSRSSAWFSGSTSGSSPAGSAPTTSSPPAWWILLFTGLASLPARLSAIALAPRFSGRSTEPASSVDAPCVARLRSGRRGLVPRLGRPSSFHAGDSRDEDVRGNRGALAVALPRRTLHLEDLARARGVDPAKYVAGPRACGRWRSRDPGEDTVALAATAARRLLDAHRRRTQPRSGCWRWNRDRRRPQQAGRLVRAGAARGCRGRCGSSTSSARLLRRTTAALMAAAEWIASGVAGRRARAGHLLGHRPLRCADRRASPPRARVRWRCSSPQRPELLALDLGLNGTQQHPRLRLLAAAGPPRGRGRRHYSIECYLEALSGAYRDWRGTGRGPGDRPPGARRVAERAAGAASPTTCRSARWRRRPTPGSRRCDLDDVLARVRRRREEREARGQLRVAGRHSSLTLCARVGNIYTGSLYLGLAGMLSARRCGAGREADRPLLLRKRLRQRVLLRRGGARAPRSRSRAARLDEVLASRDRVDVAEYERLMALPAGQPPQIAPRAGSIPLQTASSSASIRHELRGTCRASPAAGLGVPTCTVPPGIAATAGASTVRMRAVPPHCAMLAPAIHTRTRTRRWSGPIAAGPADRPPGTAPCSLDGRAGRRRRGPHATHRRNRQDVAQPCWPPQWPRRPCRAALPHARRNVAIVLYDGVELLDFAGPDRGLHRRRELRRVPRVHRRRRPASRSLSQNAVARPSPTTRSTTRSRPGHPGAPRRQLERRSPAARQGDGLGRPGGAGRTSCRCRSAAAPSSSPGWGSSTGSAATHWGALPGLAASVPQGAGEDPTCASSTAVGSSPPPACRRASDGALHVVQRLLGDDAAWETARYMQYDHWEPAESLRAEQAEQGGAPGPGLPATRTRPTDCSLAEVAAKPKDPGRLLSASVGHSSSAGPRRRASPPWRRRWHSVSATPHPVASWSDAQLGARRASAPLPATYEQLVAIRGAPADAYEDWPAPGPGRDRPIRRWRRSSSPCSSGCRTSTTPVPTTTWPRCAAIPLRAGSSPATAFPASAVSARGGAPSRLAQPLTAYFPVSVPWASTWPRIRKRNLA